MSVRSMTGFARVRGNLPEGELAFSIRSVNHRGLDVHFHMPPELDPFEGVIRNAVKAGMARGHVQINVIWARTSPDGGIGLNRPLLEAYVRAFREASQALGISGDPDLNVAFRVPGMLQVAAPSELGPEVEKALVRLAEEALSVLNAFREREGAAIGAEMRSRCETITGLVFRMEKIRTKAVPAFQKRLKERLAELLRGAPVDPQRMAQEAAMLAERSDISEELVRLKTHAVQLHELLTGDGEVGKRLDFLLQEMNRETNTILSKTGGLGELGLTVTGLALAAKAEIDKIREQSLNLE